MIDLKPFHDYIQSLQKELAAGDATEQTHRPALKSLIQSLSPGILATNEPKHIECGAPDFLVSKGALRIGHIETKDINKSLDEAEKSEQLKRYRESLSNLILTDYLEFRWYANGEKKLTARLGTLANGGKIKRDKTGEEAVAELLNTFLSHQGAGVASPKELAVRMARLAHRIREGAEEALDKNVASALLTGLYQAFQETLISGLEIKVFADMYAQTIAYGLFAARCETDNAADFSRQNAASLIPRTNPFLKDLFYQITGPNLDDEPYKWAVDELVQMLKQADMAAVMVGFGKATGKDDPVVYFYEDFLREYDKKISEMRGVYYTPIPVVSFIVRSIDSLLKNTFKRHKGLADKDTYILDPAAGTGTFLYSVINEIHEAKLKQEQLGTWNDYLEKHLLTRLFGFELLMAPYVIAHFKLGRQLKNIGYEPKQRLGVYLTNTLEKAEKASELLMAPYLTREANEAAEIKKTKPIMVVLGNPPYSGSSANASKKVFVDPETGRKKVEFTWIGKLIEDYKVVDGNPLGEKNPKWLQDDYVKFIRFGQWRIEETKQGVLGFITNHSYLDNPTFRGMRQSLMNTFTDIYILNLHGNSKKKEVAPDGSKDENVFDIQQGVAIGIFIKEPGKNSSAAVHYYDLWGLREGKYQTLSESDITKVAWQDLTPNTPFYLFVPQNQDLLSEYEKGWQVTKIFPVNSVGIVTSRDEFVLDFDSKTLEARIDEFRATNLSDNEIKVKYKLKDNKGWNVTDSRKKIRNDDDYKKCFVKCLYHPFDIKPLFYHYAAIERSRPDVMHHMLVGENLGLLAPRKVLSEFRHTFCTNRITNFNTLDTAGSFGSGCLFPLYLYPPEEKTQSDKSGGKEGGTQSVMTTQEKREPNLNPEFIAAFSEKLGLQFITDGKGDLEQTFGPEDVFNCAYAVFHSPTYRTRYAEFLKTDFPRLPLTSNKDLFKALAAKGAALVSLHLMESPLLNNDNFITKYAVAGTNIVENVTYDEKAQRVYINKTQYFDGVPPDVWNFHIGGYQVCHKWLKDRKGRTLTDNDSQHYQKIIVALKETIRLMAEIDQAIPSWPLP
jgi:predicted helicase